MPGRLGRRLRAAGGRAARRWRRSLTVRVVGLTVVLCVLTMAVVGGFLADAISERLFDARRDQAFDEAAAGARAFQDRLDQADVPTGVELQQFVLDNSEQLSNVGGEGSAGFLLLRVPGSDAPVTINGLQSSGLTPGLLPEALREAVETESTQQAAPVALPSSDGGTTPGLAVGQRVDLALAGQYELYFVIDLGREQETLDAVQRVLVVGGLLLVLLLGGVVSVVTRLVVRPVREAAAAAARLSAGDLDQRVDVRGEDDLAALGRTFNDMAASLQRQITQLAELSRLQQRFVSDVSHELRTPLTTMRMAGEVLHEARGDLEPAASRSAELLMTQLDRFEALLADLLEMSRFDAGAAALDPEVVDLAALVARVVEHAEPVASAQGVEVAVVVPEGPVTAEVEPRRVERVVRNLVLNAVEHAEGRPVEVELAADPSAVAVLVRDHGIGLRPEDAERVFDRFWRADPARARTTGGSGLGLAISTEDAVLHGGRLEVVGQLGLGAAFRLLLPRVAGGAVGMSPLPMPVDLAPAAPPDDPTAPSVLVEGLPGVVLVPSAAGSPGAWGDAGTEAAADTIATASLPVLPPPAGRG
ncbi:MtrAB system histidine kinase MtrB [uncultured Pseudokineococcus sp.]|uniref:MtrAB system histidine kinase MtrB n=1 Tax=uncultured Pseudokineococcus sp. TaxID=1642928 RepID=UPI0026298C07|nr:MtrAB system histidine kinase MtrB [uncultured Pseudokineococcus sp.]